MSDAPQQSECPTRERVIFARGAAGTLAVQIVRVAALFGLNVLLARLLGKVGYGQFSYAISVVTILSLIACFGMDGVLLRFVAAYRAQQDWARLRGVIRHGVWLSVVAAIVVGVGGCVVVWLLGDRLAAPLRDALLVALVALLPVVTVAEVLRAGLQSLARPALAFVPRFIIRPTLLAAAVAVWALVAPWTLSATIALSLDVGVSLVAAALLWLWLRDRLDLPAREAPPAYARREWTGVGLMLMLTAALHTVNAQTDLLMVGALRGMGDAGAYKAAVQLSLLVMLGTGAANAIAASMISTAHATEDAAAMSRAASRAALVATAFALPAAGCIAALGGWLLGIFGEGFVVAWPALAVLLGGYVLNSMAGPTGLMLTMTGRQRQAAIAVGVSAVINVALNALLIPRLGLLGASAATAGSMVFAQAWMVVAVRRGTGIWTPVIVAVARRVRSV